MIRRHYFIRQLPSTLYANHFAWRQADRHSPLFQFAGKRVSRV